MRIITWNPMTLVGDRVHDVAVGLSRSQVDVALLAGTQIFSTEFRYFQQKTHGYTAHHFPYRKADTQTEARGAAS